MTDDNPKTRHVSSLNAKLLAHGYAKRPLKLDRLSDSEQVHVANVITELLGSSVSNLSQIEDLNGRLRSTEYERDRLYKSSEKFEGRCSRLEAELSAAKAREMAAERALAAEEERARALRDEVARGRKAIDGLRLAAGQEAKRAQLKADKLRDQLARAAHPPPTFELLNPVARGASAPAPGGLPLLEAGLKDLSDLRASLQEEAEAFRHVCVSTANGLNEALAAADGHEARMLLPAEFFNRGWTAHPAIADAKLRALVGDVRARLTAHVVYEGGESEEQAEEAEARARAERERAKAEADLRDRVKDLEVEIVIAKGREEEARRVADEVAKLNVHASVPSATDFEDARLREELVRQKRVLDAERAQLRDEAVRLQEQRLAFDSEREAQAEAEAAAQARSEERAAEIAAKLAALELRDVDRRDLNPFAPPSNPHSAMASSSSSSSSSSTANPASTSTATNPTRPAPTTPRKHAPARPSPLSPHAAGALKKQIQKPAQVSPKKPRQHTKKRPSLARAVMDRQHRRSIEAASPRIPQRVVPGKRSASLGSVGSVGSAGSAGSAGSGGSARSVSGSSAVLGESGTRANAAASSDGRRPEPKLKSKASSLTAGTAASLARSAKKAEGPLKSQTMQARKATAWR